MRKIVCIIGVIISLVLLAIGGGMIWVTVEGVQQLQNAELTLPTEMTAGISDSAMEALSKELDATELEALLEQLEGMDVDLSAVLAMAGGEMHAQGGSELPLLAPVMALSALVPLATTVTSYALLWFGLIGGLILLGLFGLLLSLYGFGAACGSKKQLKLLKQIAEQKAAPVAMPHAAARAASPRRPEPAPQAKPVVNRPVVPVNSWRCPVCAMENDVSDNVCVCCGERRNAAKKPGAWICQSCGTQNAENAEYCGACGGKH